MLSSKTWKAIAQTVALSFMLVILPLISWYYLNRGLDYQVAARSELGNLGNWVLPQDEDIYGNRLDPEFFKGKMLIGGVFQPSLAKTLEKLHEQFDERDDLVFVFFSHENADILDLKDAKQVIWLKQDVNQSEDFFLVDIKGVIRKTYDLNNVKQVKRLVEHTAILLPKKQDRELVFKRELEK